MQWIYAMWNKFVDPYTAWFWKMPVWVRMPGTWIAHGIVAAIVMLVIYFPASIFMRDWVAALLGAVVGVGFYVYKEVFIEALANGDAVKMVDSIGDVLGPVVACIVVYGWLI